MTRPDRTTGKDISATAPASTGDARETQPGTSGPSTPPDHPEPLHPLNMRAWSVLRTPDQALDREDTSTMDIDATPTTVDHYPIPRDTPDRRLSFGLLADFRTILVRHGYPEFGPGDLAELHNTLDRYLYGTGDSPATYRRDDPPTGEPLPAGVEVRPLGGRQEEAAQ